MSRVVLRSSSFARDLRKWIKSRPHLVYGIEATLDQLSQDYTHPSLRVHKLHGPLAGCLACSSGYDLRIVFELVDHDGAEAVLLIALGTHDEVY